MLHRRAMVRNHDDSPEPRSFDDQGQAAREQQAQTRLTELASGAVTERPWRPASVPPAAVDLLQVALWRSADLQPEDLLHALALVPAAHAEVDQLEAGLLFTARAAGLTWAQIAAAMGFNSPQACQQHHTRLMARQDRDT
jgi:hypothetical protein